MPEEVSFPGTRARQAVRSARSFCGNSPRCLSAGPQGGFGFSSVLRLGFRLNSTLSHVGNVLGCVFLLLFLFFFFKWGKEVWLFLVCFVFREGQKTILFLITELKSTRIIGIFDTDIQPI